ncbi:alcohol dehydrogenase catalytic domain-containing protein [Mesorhizobium sp. M0959]|uniref:alcohol dehydrogenase catalytic domain-containing protein n=1 Tax=unclassified Mesorhizobium TaxID=325217 RepID=UPI00333B95C7
MKAIVFEQSGAAEDVLRFREVPKPACGPRQVLLRVSARVIQPADRLFIAGKYVTQPVYPQVAGYDGAGIVEQVGEEVRELDVGRRVAFRSPGAWAEHAAVPVEHVHPVPLELSESLSDELVCQFPLNPLTAWGLLDLAPTAPAHRVLLTAARSAVAAVADQLARKRGMIVERLVREKESYRLLDAQFQVIGSGATVAAALSTAEPYHLVLDPVGGPDTVSLIERISPGGSLFSYGVLDDRSFEVKASMLLYKSLRWCGFALSGWQRSASRETLANAARECWALLAEHPGTLPVIARYGLENFSFALEHAARSAGEGKVVLI